MKTTCEPFPIREQEMCRWSIRKLRAHFAERRMNWKDIKSAHPFLAQLPNLRERLRRETA